jgi:two-component system, LytTR family, response regulator LytT
VKALPCIVIDDEMLAIEIMRWFIEDVPELEFLGGFTNPEAGLSFLKDHPEVQVVFLDIHMPFISGLDLVSHFPSHILVVFTTASSEHAIRAHDLDVVDYLLKPFNRQRFQLSINKIIRRLDENQKSTTPNGLTLEIKSNHRTRKFHSQFIIFAESFGEYVHFHLPEEVIPTLGALKDFEETLAPFDFIRIHKSYIISVSHICSYISKSIILSTGEELPIGRTYKSRVMERLERL